MRLNGPGHQNQSKDCLQTVIGAVDWSAAQVDREQKLKNKQNKAWSDIEGEKTN